MSEAPFSRRLFRGLAAAWLSAAAAAAFAQDPAPARAAALAAARPSDLPGDSIYRFRPPLVDQHGQAYDLAFTRGQPVLVSMFYGSCQQVCPMIFETIARTLGSLPPSQGQRVRALMVSIDPRRDTVEQLARLAALHRCDSRWTLARTDEGNVRELAALLGVQYRRLASGEFNHSSAILLLDREGRIAARSGLLGSVDADLVAALRDATAGAP
jgi:protein SCO1/2